MTDPPRPRRRTLLGGLLAATATPLLGTPLLAASLLAACSAQEPEPRRIRIATGSPTGVYHAVGSAFARVIGPADVLVTAASAENVRLVATGGAEVGFTQADILVTGDGPDPRIAALARVYDDLLHLVVRAGSPIVALTDLRGRRVSVGARGSGTVVTADRLLAVARMAQPGAFERHELNLDDSLSALSGGRIDAFFFSGGLPVTGVRRLGSGDPIRVVDLSRWAGGLRRDHSDVYAVRDVPASVYDAPAVATIAVPNLLVVPATLPHDTAYELTRLLMERRTALAEAHPAAERLDPRAGIATLPVPLHPGAARWYRAAKP